MSSEITKPWALMRHHAGWADIFHVESETAEGITGFYPDRDTVEKVTYTAFAVLARFATMEAASDLPPKKWTGLSRSTLHIGWADVAQG